MSKSPYGKRGGTSKNAGRTATTYTVTLPDGSTQSKRVYDVDAPTAIAAVYWHEDLATGKSSWHVVKVFANEQAAIAARCGHYRMVEAIRQ